MPLDLVLLAIAAVLAVVAVVLAVVALNLLKQVRRLQEAPGPAGTVVAERRDQPNEVVVANIVDDSYVIDISGHPVVVPEQQRLLVRRELARPSIRIAVLWAGVAHALRPESRDKIARIMRTEYKRRKRLRLRAGRRAARAAHDVAGAQSSPQPSQGWIRS